MEVGFIFLLTFLIGNRDDDEQEVEEELYKPKDILNPVNQRQCQVSVLILIIDSLSLALWKKKLSIYSMNILL